ncbi:MAG: ROK family protein [Gemmatimonadetes bacterium]|nr:ROK family protein [Gemmatimonadota bacterium]
MAVIGVDLGGTKVAAALFSRDAELLERSDASVGGLVGAEVGARVAHAVRVLRAAARERGEDVAAVGVAVPGIYRPATGTVWAPNIAGWEDYPLLAEVEEAAGGAPVRIDSDRVAYILGESWRGAARGCRDAIFLAVGTGIGAGILADGRVLRGSAGIAGAVGWVALSRPWIEPYRGVGCFEFHASGAGLAEVARRLLSVSPRYIGRLREIPPEALRAEDVFAAYDGRDPIAGQVVEEAITCWGMATANLVSLFNPEKVIFGGGVFGPAVRLLDRIREQAAHWAQPIAMQQVELVASELGGDAGVWGAGRLALDATTDASR